VINATSSAATLMSDFRAGYICQVFHAYAGQWSNRWPGDVVSSKYARMC
jgi:hypothetical protein